MRKSPLLQKQCLRCKSSFETATKLQKFCSRKCREANQPSSVKHGLNLSEGRLDTGKIGAIGELLVSADLLRRGYEVFRAVSQSCSCDLIARKNGAFIPIEVRTGWRSATGKICWIIKDDEKSLQFAVILSSAEILYVPELLSFGQELVRN